MNAFSYISIPEAIGLPGLRVVFTQGIPQPWSIGARAVLEYKAIPFVVAAQEPAGVNSDLRGWTGQTSAPVAILDDERPRISATDLVLLAERLAPEPALIPADPDDRMAMFGLLHEMCAEDGLGWSLRAMMFDAARASASPPDPGFIRKYDSGLGFEHARRRADAVLGLIGRRLASQQAKGSPYLVGDALTAADFYWAGFSNWLRPYSEDLCEMPAFYHGLSQAVLPHLEPLPETLFEHRDRTLRRLQTPLRF